VASSAPQARFTLVNSTRRRAFILPSSNEMFVETARCKRIFEVFQVFQRYVATVLYRCCKIKSGYCICCNGCTQMLQASVSNVSSVFQTYDASVFI
jgi:hypothetical protein